MLLCLGITYYANYKVAQQSKPYIFNSVDNLPHIKVGLVLGTSKLTRGGYKNPYFYYRINAAYELYKSGKIEFILVSGDNGNKSYNEPEDMKQALIDLGIPEKVIVLDFAGFRTLDSVVRAKKVFGQGSFIVISQQFHNERAVYIARSKGIEAYGYNAQDVAKNFSLRVRIREYFARAKVFLDLIFGVSPKFLGDEIEIK